MYSRRVLATASRIACSTIPRSHSSKRGTAGNIGNPAASPEVQPAGRSAFEFKSNFAPFDACQPLCVNFICHVSQNDPEPGATMMPWRSPPLLFTSICHCCRVKLPVPCGHDSIGMFGGIGYFPLGNVPPSRSDSSG